MKNEISLDLAQSPWKLFWLGINATAAGAWCAVCVAAVVATALGIVAPSATGGTVGLLLGLGWLVGAIRSVRAERRFPRGLFWFAISATVGAAGSVASAAALDITRRTEALDQGGLAPLGLALVCGLIWFVVSIWGAASLASRAKRKGF
jgi:hypothetical protein